MDLLILKGALCLAFFIRFGIFFSHPELLEIYWKLAVPLMAVQPVIFYFFGLYHWSFRYASLSEALRLFGAVSLSSLMLISFVALVLFQQFPTEVGRTVLLINYLLSLLAHAAFRFSFRVLLKAHHKYQNHIYRKELKKILILGTGDAAEIVVRELLNGQSEKRRYEPVGLIDDDPNKKNLRIHGIKVLGGMDQIPPLVKQYGVEEILIAMPYASGEFIRRLIAQCRETNIKLKLVPGLEKILSDKVNMKQVRDVLPEDLLGRPVVEIYNEQVRTFVQNKVVLVTGAGGSIGSQLCRRLAEFEPQMFLLCDLYENNVYFLHLELKKKYPLISFRTIIGDTRDIALLKHTFSKYRPNIVFHAAAHKHVTLMEENPVAAAKNNVLATRNLVYASNHYGVEKFVLISTDKAVNPVSRMGLSKRLAEILVQNKARQSRTKLMAVRFGNVIGSEGSVVQLFKKQIEEGGPLTVTHPDMKRYFMTIDEAAQLVIQAAAMGEGGEIFILDMGEPIKILDLARHMVTLSGMEVDKDIKIEFIGLRPGEKLYEQIILDPEQNELTRHGKIFVAYGGLSYPLRQLRQDLKALEGGCQRMDALYVIEKMREIVFNVQPLPAGKCS